MFQVRKGSVGLLGVTRERRPRGPRSPALGEPRWNALSPKDEFVGLFVGVFVEVREDK